MLYIITGASRGIGEALCKRLLTANQSNRVVGIARATAPPASLTAFAANSRLQWLSMDLSAVGSSNVDEFVKRFESILPSTAEDVALVHNAGTINPISKLGDELVDNCDRMLLEGVNVNYLCPLILTHAFVRRIKQWSSSLRAVVAISSGAARSPYPSWATYCGTKAALEMTIKCLHVEKAGDGVRCLSIAPGIIETQMQSEIRATTKEQFELVDLFNEFKNEDKLWSADFTAEKLVEHFLSSAALRARTSDDDPVVDLRDAVGEGTKVSSNKKIKTSKD